MPTCQTLDDAIIILKEGVIRGKELLERHCNFDEEAFIPS